MWPGRARSAGVGRRVDQRVHGRAAVGGGDAGRRAVLGVDRDRERGALALGVLRARHHQRQLQLVEPLALHRQADHAARVADHERHLLGRHLLGRDDEVALVLAVLVVDDDDELAARDRVDGSFDRVEGHGVLRLAAAERSTYLAIRSTSRFTRSPGGAVPSVVTASVCGITATANAVVVAAGDGEADAVDGDRTLVHDVAQHVGRRVERARASSRRAAASRARTVPVASTWPCTRWPPSRSASRTGRSRFTAVAGGEVAEVRAARASRSPRRPPSDASPSATTVRQQPLTAIDAPIVGVVEHGAARRSRGARRPRSGVTLAHPARAPRRCR